MNLDELRSVQSKERRKDSLQQLRDSFYQDVAAYIQDLRAERDRRAEQVDNPFSDDEVRQLSDKLDTAEEVAEALYERRVGKVVKLASFAAADMSASEEGMTIEEQELFDDLVDRIKRNKASVLDVLAGEQTTDNSPATDTTGSPVSTPTESTPPTESPATATDDPTTIGGADPHDEGAPPTPPEADAEADDVLANAMGGAAEAESGETEQPPAGEPASDTEYEGGSDAALGDTTPTDTTDGDDGVPTPDGGSTVGSAQSSDTPPTQPTPSSPGNSESGASPSQAPQPESTEPTTGSTAPPESDTTTGTGMATPDGESAATEPAVPESPSTESAPTESTPTGTTATAAMAEPEPAAESTTNESATQQSTQQEPDATTEPVAAAADTTPRTVVRITDDVGTIFGVDEREYTLQAEDVVTLPTTNAEVLLQQDAATKLE